MMRENVAMAALILPWLESPAFLLNCVTNFNSQPPSESPQANKMGNEGAL